MTRIRFYTGVADAAGLIQHLLVQALGKQRQTTIYVPDQHSAEQMSAQLWQAPAARFLPNILAGSPEAAYSPIILAWLPEQIAQDDVLVNCQPAQPLFFGRFRHLFEVVGLDEVAKAAGRQRYAFYRDRGYEIQHMNMQA